MRRAVRTFVALAAVLAWTCVIAAEPAGGSAGPSNAVGFDLDLGALPSPHPRPSPLPAAPDRSAVWVRVIVPWDVIEKVAGQYDWAVADAIIGSHAAAGYAVALSPRDGNPLFTEPAGIERGWTAFLRALATRYQSQAGHVILGEGLSRLQDMTPAQGAYWLKLSSVAVRASSPQARVALGLDLDGGDVVPFLDALFAEGIDVYVDAVAVRTARADRIPGIRQLMLLKDPSARLWWVGRPVEPGAAAAGLLRGYLEALRQEVALTTFRLEPGPDGMPATLGVLERIRGAVSPSHAPLVESGRGIHLMTPMGQEIPALIVRLFDPEEKTVLIGYDAGPGAQRGAQAVLVVDSSDVAEPLLMDLPAGEQAVAGAYQKDEAEGVTRLALPIADYPLVLRYRRFTSPLFGEEERLQVTEVRQPSVEEIIAQHQAFQAAQDALLTNWRAEARIDFRFRLGSGTTFDITVQSGFFYDPLVGPEFEQREYFVNGVKWRATTMPEFPLPQPEKVFTLPLDIALDRRYAYRLEGEETIDGYDCWVVSFDPLVAEDSLYQGRIWIDKKTHARVQVSSLQTGLKPPILSNDQTDSFRPLVGPEGLTYWLLSHIQGQQLFSTSGRNLTVYRDVSFSQQKINDAGFVAARQTAYASEHTMVRETAQGQRYLERTSDGNRVVRSELDKDILFALGGVFYNQSLDYPLPLAGVNYFNRNLWGKGAQTNIFFAGALAFGNLSQPDMLGTGLEGSADIFLQGFSASDTPVSGGDEIDEEAVDLTQQNIELGLGLPFADHWKVKWTAGLRFEGFSKAEDTSSDFLLPTDTLVSTVGMEGEFNKRTWRVAGGVRVADRSTWEPWGLPGNTDFSEDAADYVQYDGIATKEFFLPLNQKIHTEVAASGGGDLDRFSKYRFDYFGNRLRGFGGAGFRYTNGGRAQVQYAFNFTNLIRFEATVDHARVRDRAAAPGEENGFQDFTGFGISGQTIVGPNLILTLDWGIAVASDIKDYRGDQEIFVTILRLW
ncbi:MAG: hypothetical protein ACREAA_12250 [Candidatus Polarisedimenticolia bacterium]